MAKITSRERNVIIKALAAGVVPGIGLEHIQVGRLKEVSAVISDLKAVEGGASSVRFVVGRYGSGKTFFLTLAKNVALQRHFVVLQADITPERRLFGATGQARSLFSELVKSLATRAKPEGGALPGLVERWIAEVDQRIRGAGGADAEVKRELARLVRPLTELVGGFDFLAVITRYYEGFLTHNDELQAAALRWLRAEYTTKTQARAELGVRTVIDDESFYDHLKLLAAFVRLAGYTGLMVNIDELAVLSFRVTSAVARNNNYEAILRILNSCLQGTTCGLVVLFAGTTECLEDRRRGLYSYEALATRLAPSGIALNLQNDASSPVIQLEALTAEDCFVLLSNVRSVFSAGDESIHLIPDEGIESFLKYCQGRIGASVFQTPRNTVRAFVTLLTALEQSPTTKWHDLLNSTKVVIHPDHDEASVGSAAEDDDLSSLTL